MKTFLRLISIASLMLFLSGGVAHAADISYGGNVYHSTAVLNASPASIVQGSKSVLSWSTSMTEDIYGSGGGSLPSYCYRSDGVHSERISSTGPCANPSPQLRETKDLTSKISCFSYPTLGLYVPEPKKAGDPLPTSEQMTSLYGQQQNYVPHAGSVSVSPPTTQQYQVICDFPGPVSSQGVWCAPDLSVCGASPQASDWVSMPNSDRLELATTVAVTPSAASAAPTVSVSANPMSVFRGNSTIISWSSANAASCTSLQINTNGATSGSVVSTPTGDTTYTVSCTGAGGSASDFKTVTVSSLPDLTASAISPATATGSYVSTISNSGTAGTGSGFSVLFQAATDATGANAADVGTSALGALGVSGSAPASFRYTPSAGGGVLYLRACADKSSSSDPGLIPESNEGNNCGPWTQITVPGASGSGYLLPLGSTSPSISHGNQPSLVLGALLSADPLTIIYGLASTLTWSSQNAVSCIGSPGDFNTNGKTSGVMQVFPSVTTTYFIDCKNASGTDAYDSRTVTVTPPLLSLTASPALVRSGDSSVISWSVRSGPVSCLISGPGISSHELSGSQSVVITSESTYILTCDAGAFHPSQSVTIILIPQEQEF